MRTVQTHKTPQPYSPPYDHMAARIAAIVPAAGKSSRMGTSKPLLPLGATTVIERLVNAILRAGVRDIIVVTGHNSDELAPVLERQPVCSVHNPDYELGMFSSVRAGASALQDDVEAFFILPADYPLVGPRTLAALVAAFRSGEHTVVHPLVLRTPRPPPVTVRRPPPALVTDKHQQQPATLPWHAC